MFFPSDTNVKPFVGCGLCKKWHWARFGLLASVCWPLSCDMNLGLLDMGSGLRRFLWALLQFDFAPSVCMVCSVVFLGLGCCPSDLVCIILFPGALRRLYSFQNVTLGTSGQKGHRDEHCDLTALLSWDNCVLDRRPLPHRRVDLDRTDEWFPYVESCYSLITIMHACRPQELISN